jgi:hypothetical protein
MFLDIIDRPVFILKHKVSGTGFCLPPQEKPTKMGPIFFLNYRGGTLGTAATYFTSPG